MGAYMDYPNNFAASVDGVIINFSWDEVVDYTTEVYQILECDTPDGEYTSIGYAVHVLTYEWDYQTPNVLHYYKIKVVSPEESELSPYISVTTILLPPTSFLASWNSNNHAALSWVAAADAYSYDISYAVVTGGPYSTVTTTESTSYEWTGASTDTTYYFIIRTYANPPSGYSEDSAETMLLAKPPTSNLLFGFNF
jgi:hypothetical protein